MLVTTTPDAQQTRASGSRQGRRNDPDRRDRIVDACLEVIARAGVAGTSHRKVAAEADVPLGATTYYFDGLDDLLHAAFERFAASASEGFDARLAGADGPEAAREAVVALIVHDIFQDERSLVLSHELYTLAAREPRFRTITSAWMRRSQVSLGRHFDPATARMVDALIEGLTIHRALDDKERDVDEVVEAVRRITG